MTKTAKKQPPSHAELWAEAAALEEEARIIRALFPAPGGGEMKGYWFCSHCDDVVILPQPLGRWDAKRGVECPACHSSTADWTPDTVGKLAAFKELRQWAERNCHGEHFQPELCKILKKMK